MRRILRIESWRSFVFKMGVSRLTGSVFELRSRSTTPKTFVGSLRCSDMGKSRLELLESNDQLSEVLDRLKNRSQEREFLNHLEEIKELIDSLHPAEFRGLKAEIEMIRKIKHLVSKKLWRFGDAVRKRSSHRPFDGDSFDTIRSILN